MSMFDTIRQAENLAREHGRKDLADDLYALGCELGRRTLVKCEGHEPVTRWGRLRGRVGLPWR